MPENTRVLIMNNFNSIAVHVCMCIAFIFPLIFLYGIGAWSGETLVWFAVGVYTVIALFLYFLAGKSLLYNMRTIENVISVVGLSVILAALIYVSYDFNVTSMLIMPFYPIGGAISSFFEIEEKFCYLAAAFLPSLMMLAGTMTQRRGYNSSLLMGAKKVYMVYLIVLFGLTSFLITFLLGVSAFEPFLTFLIAFLVLFCFNVVFLSRHSFFYVFSKSSLITKTLRISFLLYLSILFSFVGILAADILFHQFALSMAAADDPNLAELFKLFMSVVFNLTFLIILKVLVLNAAHRRIYSFDTK